MRKKAIIALTLAICLTGQALAASFSDVSSSYWAYEYIEKASQNGWVTGKGDNIYDPNGNVTTAEFYTLLARAFYSTEVPTTTKPYKLYSEKWYAPYFEVGENHNFDRFYVNKVDTITEAETSIRRSEMASLIHGILEDKSITISNSIYDTVKIPDINEVITDYQKSVITVYALGIITGIDKAGNFNPDGLMTRAQVAAVLCRLNDVIENSGSISKPNEYTLADGSPITEENVYRLIVELKSEYPEGMHWTNDNFYKSDSMNIIGYGCAGFAFICSDAAFGSLPVTNQHSNFDDILIGDILRINNDTHSVVVLEKKDNSVIVTEGNFNSSIHWGREISRQSLEEGNFVVTTRYPN